ncbi:hypothetical protein dsx2_2315 [Desulfovibrio sp. X2]|nr:hypothetical protein dsx2_2315 [Desulfovibrio sp. X2]
MRFRENDTVRLTDAITARPSFGELDEVHLRRGQLGAVIDTLGDCGAYEVEFILQKPVFGTDGSLIDVGKFCVVTLKEHQIEPDYGSALGDESD